MFYEANCGCFNPVGDPNIDTPISRCPRVSVKPDFNPFWPVVRDTHFVDEIFFSRLVVDTVDNIQQIKPVHQNVDVNIQFNDQIQLNTADKPGVAVATKLFQQGQCLDDSMRFLC